MGVGMNVKIFSFQVNIHHRKPNHGRSLKDIVMEHNKRTNGAALMVKMRAVHAETHQHGLQQPRSDLSSSIVSIYHQ